MKQDGLAYFSDTYLTVIGLIIFLGYFLMILTKALKAPKEQIKHLENIPFASEDGQTIQAK